MRPLAEDVLAPENAIRIILKVVLANLVRLLDEGMQVVAALHLDIRADLAHAAGDDGEIVRHGGALLVRELSGDLVAHPAVHASAARVDKEKVLEAEVRAQGALQGADGGLHEGPALDAELGAGAARADLVVVVHVDIKDELSLKRLVGILHHRGVVFRRMREDRADLHADRLPRHNLCFELVHVAETKVAAEDVALQDKRELPPQKEVFLHPWA
mmetsp:Transcript_118182/g.294826  ORF Transcript_118182/g.294826 Transcript_118182/m.294826 type:complete len:215 (-) Transcript_118182:384-1028(-)